MGEEDTNTNTWTLTYCETSRFTALVTGAAMFPWVTHWKKRAAIGCRSSSLIHIQLCDWPEHEERGGLWTTTSTWEDKHHASSSNSDALCSRGWQMMTLKCSKKIKNKPPKQRKIKIRVANQWWSEWMILWLRMLFGYKWSPHYIA